MNLLSLCFRVGLLFLLTCSCAFSQSLICLIGTVTGGGGTDETRYCYSGFESMDELWEFLGRNDPEVGGGGGGGGGSGGIIRDSFDNPNNATPATCRSNDEIREEHAQGDGRFMYAEALRRGMRVPRAGELYRVRYDDGGTEVWEWSGMSPPYSFPIEGTLQCP